MHKQRVTIAQGIITKNIQGGGLDLYDYPDQTKYLQKRLTFLDLLPDECKQEGAVIEFTVNVNARVIPKRTKPDFANSQGD